MKLKPADDRVLKPAPRETAPIAEALAQTVRQTAPELKEQIAWGNLCFFGNNWVLAIVPHKSHVNLQFEQGGALAEGGAPLEGTGKNMRHFKVKSIEVARSPIVAELIRKAVSLDEEQNNV